MRIDMLLGLVNPVVNMFGRLTEGMAPIETEDGETVYTKDGKWVFYLRTTYERRACRHLCVNYDTYWRPMQLALDHIEEPLAWSNMEALTAITKELAAEALTTDFRGHYVVLLADDFRLEKIARTNHRIRK